MKKLLLISIVLLITHNIFSQDISQNQNTINVNGIARKTVLPSSYKIKFLLQEEEKLDGYKPIGKTSIDSIRTLFFENIKAYGFKETDITLVKKGSVASNRSGGAYLNNLIYESQNIKLDIAQKLVDNLRLTGLKGVVAKSIYPAISKTVQDSLYGAALQDAANNAFTLAKLANKSVGEIYNIRGNYYFDGDQVNFQYEDNNYYNLTKFEINIVDKRLATSSLQITYELKKQIK